MTELLSDEVVTVIPYVLSHADSSHLTGAWSLHGQSEIMGGMAELCAYELEMNSSSARSAARRNGYTQAKWMQFTTCQQEEYKKIPSRSSTCAERTAEGSSDALYNWTELRTCMREKAQDYITESREKASTYNAYWSPTMYIDGEKDVCNL